MTAVEDNRALAGNVADGPSDPIDKDTFNDRNAGKIDDTLNVNRGPLTGKCEKTSSSSASQLVSYFSTIRRVSHLNLPHTNDRGSGCHLFAPAR
jgi:hypothetical protein